MFIISPEEYLWEAVGCRGKDATGMVTGNISDTLQIRRKTDQRSLLNQDIHLYYILDGSMSVYVGDQASKLQTEDMILVNANKKYRMESADEKLLYLDLIILAELICEVCGMQELIFYCDSAAGDDERFDQLRAILKKILNHYVSSGGSTNDFVYYSDYFQLLNLLSLHFQIRSSDRKRVKESERFEERIAQINTYIHANYSRQIGLKDLSDKLYLSNGYLSRFFKKNFGMTFAEYLTQIRLKHAVDDLLSTDLPVTRIAYNNGFTNVTSFNKSFKTAYGDTPVSYRKKHRRTVDENLTEYEEETVQRLSEIVLAGGAADERRTAAAHISICETAKSVGKLQPVWNEMINAGSAENLLNSKMQEHLRILKEAFHIRYVRIWNLFSPGMLMDPGGNPDTYNFSRLDTVLDFLVQAGLKPHIDLGAKPVRVQKNALDMLEEYEKAAPSYDLDVWENFVDKLIRHLVLRYDRSETDTWRIELWWDEGRRKSEESAVQYFEYFARTKQVIRQRSPALEVGGYGTFLEYYQEDTYLKPYMREICPDFVSVYLYSYIRGEDSHQRFAKRNTNVNALSQELDRIRMLARETGFPTDKIYVVEWNITVSDRNFINDSCFKGANMIKNFLDFYGKTPMAAYFAGSDQLSEHYDSSAPLFGGKGVLSRDGILKPAGYALEFLGRLYSGFIAKGDNYIITTDNRGCYGIVCHNMQRLNCNYYFTGEDEIDKDQLWKYFETCQSLQITIVLRDLPGGHYCRRVFRVNEKNGNILGIWKEMGYSEKLSRADIKYMRRACEPRMQMQYIYIDAADPKIEILLEPNEILYLQIQKTE